MSDIYIVISVGDGASIERLTRAKLEERLNEKWWGDKPVHDYRAFDNGPIDLMATHGLYIVKGDCIKPKPRKVIETWEL